MESALKPPISIFIAEDFEITRVGLRLTLGQIPEFSIVGEAVDGESAVSAVLTLCPDIVLMDIGLPIMNGIEATAQIKTKLPQTKIIILTSHDDDRDVFAAIAAGADGYCLKEVSSAQLSSAIKAVADGVGWLDAGVAGRVFKASVSRTRIPAIVPTSSRPPTKGNNKFPPLSQRELDVLVLVVEGRSNQEIADRLVVSVETIKTHMRHIMEKLSVSDRTQAAVKAMREGLV